MEKTIELTMKERAVLLGMLPVEGSKLQQIIVKDLLDKIRFTEQEEKEFKIVRSDTAINWNDKAAKMTFKFSLNAPEISILKEVSADTDKNKKVNQHNLSLILKIDQL